MSKWRKCSFKSNGISLNGSDLKNLKPLQGIKARVRDSRDERRAPRRRREGGGGGAAAAPPRMASVRAVPIPFRGGRVTERACERASSSFARSPDCNFQSSESKSGILSSPIESTNFERERRRGREEPLWRDGRTDGRRKWVSELWFRLCTAATPSRPPPPPTR